jgi:hypothetical protein
MARMRHCSPRSSGRPTILPPAAGDPIVTIEQAVRLVDAALGFDETLIVLLDEDRAGRSLLSITGTRTHDQVVGVVRDLLVPLQERVPVTAILATGWLRIDRPGPDEEHTWFELRCLADEHGIDLVDWFVAGGTYIASMAEFTESIPGWS